MSLKDNPAILRSIIMDHYEYPRNHSLTQDETYTSKHMASASCIDDIEVQLKMVDGIVEDIRFDGTACTIATSSTSIMSELLKGRNEEEVKMIMDQYFQMINGQEYDEDILQEAVAFCNVGRQANRIKCATIGWRAIADLMGIEEYKDE